MFVVVVVVVGDGIRSELQSELAQKLNNDDSFEQNISVRLNANNYVRWEHKSHVLASIKGK